MIETLAERTKAVKRLVEAAKKLHQRRQAIARTLEASTGLSQQGAIRALERSLEWDATPEEIDAFVARATPAASVTVVLSANVFTASFRAIAWARAKSIDVVVRPSRREPHFTDLLIEEANDRAIRRFEEVEFESLGEGELHVYGHDSTITSIDERLRNAKYVGKFVGHGSGMGIAVVDASDPEAVARAAAAIADDVVLFDQRGCLSPRVVFARAAVARTLARKLNDALDDFGSSVPRGHLDDDERAAETTFRQTMNAVGEVYEEYAHSVAVLESSSDVVVPPIGRNVLVVPVASLDEVETKLGALRSLVVAMGTDAPDAASWAQGVRVSPLGQMQRPRLDGPVDRRGG